MMRNKFSPVLMQLQYKRYYFIIISTNDIIRVTDIRHCRKLEDFLVLILKTGNYMNFGGHSGDAHGFKITSLLRVFKKSFYFFICFLIFACDN